MTTALPKLVVFLDDGSSARDACIRLAAVLAKLGMPWRTECVAAAIDTELPSARFHIGFTPVPHAPETFELWPRDPNRLDDEINDLIARLFTGAKRDERPKPQPTPTLVEQAAKPKAIKAHTVKIGRETKGRRGNGVTLISDLPANMTDVERTELTTLLKSRCGTGGTCRDGIIEIQGDQRDRLTVELEKLGYKVKRAGG